MDAPLKKVAERLGVTPTQVIFLWVKAKGAVIVTYVPAIPYVTLLQGLTTSGIQN